VGEQIPRSVFNIIRQASNHKNNGIVAGAKGAICFDAEPLCPGNADEIGREAGAGNLPIAFDRYAGGALAGGGRAADDKVVREPAQIAALPLDPIDLAEIDAERVRPGQKIEEEARGNAILVAETHSRSEANRGLL